jgi:hypothetical protein
MAAGVRHCGRSGLGINNQVGCCGWESEGFIVVMKAGTTGLSEGTLVRIMLSQKQSVLIGESLGQRKQRELWTPLVAEIEAGLSDQVARCMSDGKVAPDESRMREICTSGLSRGRAASACACIA